MKAAGLRWRDSGDAKESTDCRKTLHTPWRREISISINHRLGVVARYVLNSVEYPAPTFCKEKAVEKNNNFVAAMLIALVATVPSVPRLPHPNGTYGLIFRHDKNNLQGRTFRGD